MQELHGQNVNQFKKLEINLIVEVVGLLVQLKLCQTEFAFNPVKHYKQESQQTI